MGEALVGSLTQVLQLQTLLLMLFTVGLEPVEAFALLLGMLAVTSTAGDITSVLFGCRERRRPRRQCSTGTP